MAEKGDKRAEKREKGGQEEGKEGRGKGDVTKGVQMQEIESIPPDSRNEQCKSIERMESC